MEVEERLPGGNVGGAWRVGNTVRRPTGPWTPAVHALLVHLAGRLDAIPAVHGLDERGREVLEYLPGEVVAEAGDVTDVRLRALAGWAARLHAAVAGFNHRRRLRRVHPGRDTEGGAGPHPGPAGVPGRFTRFGQSGRRRRA